MVNPPDGDTLSIADTLHFRWHKAVDPNSDTLTYALNITGSGLDTTFTEITDTSFSLYGATILEENHTYNWKVLASDSQYTTSSSDIWSFVTSGAVGIVNNIPQIAEQQMLFQNYPNPFNPATTIEFALAKTEFVTLKIYNILGEQVAILVSEKLPAGKYKFEWDAKGMANGVYFYRIETMQGFVQTRKLLLVR